MLVEIIYFLFPSYLSSSFCLSVSVSHIYLESFLTYLLSVPEQGRGNANHSDLVEINHQLSTNGQDS